MTKTRTWLPRRKAAREQAGRIRKARHAMDAAFHDPPGGPETNTSIERTRAVWNRAVDTGPPGAERLANRWYAKDVRARTAEREGR